MIVRRIDVLGRVVKRIKRRYRRKSSCSTAGFNLRASFALCHKNAFCIFRPTSLVGDFAPQTLEVFGNFVAVSALKQTQF